MIRILHPTPRFLPLWEHPRPSFSAVSRAVRVCQCVLVFCETVGQINVSVGDVGTYVYCVNNCHEKGLEVWF